MIITFDLFSALTDSARGGGATFAALARDRGWSVTGCELYTEWDRRNKEAQRRAGTTPWRSFRELSRDALAATYTALGLTADAGADTDRVLGSVGDWPLWPDVTRGLAARAPHARLGIPSNVDDDVATATRAYPLVEAELVLTSQKLGAYKPDPAIYLRAREVLDDDVVHCASSARDVRGALEAGIPTVRLVRPGHQLDPEGPVPAVTITEVGFALVSTNPPYSTD